MQPNSVSKEPISMTKEKQEQKTSNLKDRLEQKETKYAYFDPLSTKVLVLMLVRSAMAGGA